MQCKGGEHGQALALGRGCPVRELRAGGESPRRVSGRTVPGREDLRAQALRQLCALRVPLGGGHDFEADKRGEEVGAEVLK